MKVYTKSGDTGSTALIGGERVDKFDSRVEAYGTIDELTAFIGLLGDKMRADGRLQAESEELCLINSTLMNVEAHLAASEQNEYPLPKVTVREIELLERRIDEMQGKLPQINKFTIPGGCELNSMCHVCRTICRRGERRAIVVSVEHKLDPNILQYLNRLSDYFYLLGRTLSAHCKVEELLWIPTNK